MASKSEVHSKFLLSPNREQSKLLELPRCEGEEPKVNESITPLRKYIAIGYALIALLIGGIVFIYLGEWRELERIEAESKEVNMLRQKVHDAYAQMLDLTLYGEKVLEWNAEDTLIYRGKRLAMDSILCEFKQH